MLTLPTTIIQVLRHFEVAFSERTWAWATVLLVGALLAPSKRTVTAAVRVMGLSREPQFQHDHRVLNRATWSSRARSHILLRLLVRTFVPGDAPIVVGLDEHIERRRGDHIASKGIYRDAVRSSTSCFVTTSGLRGLAMMLLVPIPWAHRVWAWPVLTVLAPSERSHRDRGQRHKPLTDWGRQMIRQVRRWLPARAGIVGAASTYAVLELLADCAQQPHPVTMITRLRLDAALYEPAPLRRPGSLGAPRKKGARQPTLAQRLPAATTTWTTSTVAWYGRSARSVDIATGTAVWYHVGKPVVPLRWVLLRDPLKQFKPQALLCTDVTVTPAQIVEWFVLRWQLEVTVEEARAHLGIETQRQWSEVAILRTTPALLSLCALITLFAHQLLQGRTLSARRAAWDQKSVPTFSDTLAFVRQHLWPVALSYMSPAKPDMIEIPRALFERLTNTLAFAV
jgi:hypothetical protein